MKKSIAILFLLLSSFSFFAQNVSDKRTLYVKNPRMNGDDVFYIQNKLIEMGFSEIGKPDGKFGPVTEEAVKTFQQLAGFAPSGHVTEEIYDFFNTKNSKGIMDMIAVYNEKKGAKKVLKRPDYKNPKFPEDDQVLKVYGTGQDASYCSLIADYDYYRGELDVFKVDDSAYMLVISESYADLPDGANLWEHYSYEFIIQTTTYYLINGKFFKAKNGTFEEADNKELLDYVNYCKQYLK